ncbi:Ras GTPase, partial [Mortierella alpina]
YDPTIEDSYCKHITVDGQDYILDLTDTSGQFEYRSHWNDSFMRSADGFICVYSIASLGSFRELVGYRDQIWRAKDSEHVPIMMVGNKCDLEGDSERRVGTRAVARFAERSNALFLEASAKSGKNIDSVFIDLVREIERQRRMRDGQAVVGAGYDAHPQEMETWASIKGFATNVTPPASAPVSPRDMKNGHCGCTIM